MGRYAKTKLMELDVSKFFIHDKRGSKLATNKINNFANKKKNSAN